MSCLERLLPAALPYSDEGPTEVTCHPMQCVLRLTSDHVVPRASGGSNDPDNLVVSFGACNFNKGSCTIEELGLTDPRDRPQIADGWDGLNARLASREL